MKMEKCSGCEFYHKIEGDKSYGWCANLALISTGDSGIRLHDKKTLDEGMILVGKNFGCVHFKKK